MGNRTPVDQIIESPTPDRRGSSALEVDHLCIEYSGQAGSVLAVDDINLTCAPGEFVAIVGPSGCGKSSILKVIAGLVPATSGEVRVGGKVVDDPPESLWMMFQTPVLLDWLTVEDNIALPIRSKGIKRKSARETAHRLLERVGLRDSAVNMPCELSGGMQQRVALCRALASQPSLLLMDEPLSALDALLRDQLSFELQSIWLAEGFSGVLVTHSVLEAVTLADRVIVMSSTRPGRIVEVVNVDLERPRTRQMRAEVRFQEIVQEISDILYRSDDENVKGANHE